MAEAAEFLGISTREVRSLERSGILRAAVPFNADAERRKVRFTAAALRAYAGLNRGLDALLDRLWKGDGERKEGTDSPPGIGARRLLTVAETAEFLGLSPAEVRGYERSGFLSATVPHARGTRRRRILFTADSLREFIRTNRGLDQIAEFFESGP